MRRYHAALAIADAPRCVSLALRTARALKSSSFGGEWNLLVVVSYGASLRESATTIFSLLDELEGGALASWFASRWSTRNHTTGRSNGVIAYSPLLF